MRLRPSLDRLVTRPEPGLAGRYWTAVALGGLALVAAGAACLLADWALRTQLVRPWSQVSGAFAAAALLAGAALPRVARRRRLLAYAAGALTLLTVLDSLDGRQDVFTGAFFDAACLAFLFSTLPTSVLRDHPRRRPRHLVALAIGAGAALAFAAAAAYGVALAVTAGRTLALSSDVRGAGMISFWVVAFIGEVWPAGSAELSGPVRTCPSCGLRNIAERRTCKRCRHIFEP